MSKLALIVLVACNKGGAGKSTTATNISVCLANEGSDVLLIDADPQRSVKKWYGYRLREGIKSTNLTVMQADGDIEETLHNQKNKYDYIIVDTPGRNSDELASGSIVADLILAPHQCTQFDLDTMLELEKQAKVFTRYNKSLEIYAYQTMASTNPKGKIIERATFKSYCSDFSKIKCLNSIGHYRQIYRDVTENGSTVVESNNKLAKKEIDDLVDELFFEEESITTVITDMEVV